MSRRKLLIATVIVTLLVIVIGYPLLPPKVEISALSEARGPGIAITGRNVNSVMNVTFWSFGKKEEWSISFDRQSFPATLLYGQLPDQGYQVFPENNEPPRKLEKGRWLMVSVGAQYDRAIPPSACAGDWWFELQYDGTKFVNVRKL
jgi:hypothetical protein